MKEQLLKIAADLRKLAEEHDKKKQEKCAKVMMGAIALNMLNRKIRG